MLDEKFRRPLYQFKFPPRADICLEGMFNIIFRYFVNLLTQDTGMHEDEGNHQEQVKELIKETATCLDDLALKILFQQVESHTSSSYVRLYHFIPASPDSRSLSPS